MTIFLGLILALWILCGLAWRWASRSGDDFGAGAMALIVLVIATILTLVYLGLAFWLGRFV
jgi:hypothetical protein